MHFKKFIKWLDRYSKYVQTSLKAVLACDTQSIREEKCRAIRWNTAHTQPLKQPKRTVVGHEDQKADEVNTHLLISLENTQDMNNSALWGLCLDSGSGTLK